MAQLIVANDEVDLAQRAAERLTALIEQAVSAHGRALVSLTGGTTPRRLYAALADPRQPWSGRIPWSQVHLFWGDERHVPPDHPDSNYGMAKAALLDHVPIPADHVHRMRGELPDPQDAAADYERALTDVVSAFSLPADVVSGFSRTFLFDIMLLGVGDDAHIASIFPGSELLEPEASLVTGREGAVGRPFMGRRVAAVWAAHLNAWRITLTPEALLDSRALVVIVSGAKKAAAVRAALSSALDVKTYPAQLLRAADDRVEWLVDRSAATLL
jgi:6-phosphogluconolactonase